MRAKEIAWLLATRHSSPFKARKQLAVVPNVSWSMLPWEADLLVLGRSGYLQEIEIKITMADWKKDGDKNKHRADIGWREREMIKKFWYACPEALAGRYQELELPQGSGVVSVSERGINVLRAAAPIPGHRKLTDKEQARMLRLAAIKAWGLYHRPLAESGNVRGEEK